MAESVVKTWFSDEIIGSLKNTTIMNRLNIGPESINLIQVSDSNKDGITIKCSQTPNPNYIYDKRVLMSAKPTITIIGNTAVDSRCFFGGASKYNGACITAVDGGGASGWRWTGEGSNINRFFLPKTASLAPLALNQILDTRSITLNSQTETFKPSAGFINALAHMASDSQKEGKSHGDFTVDPYDAYTYYAPQFPQLGHSCPLAPDTNPSIPIQYPYGYDIAKDVAGYNVLEKRHSKLPDYTTTFYNNTTGAQLQTQFMQGIHIPINGDGTPYFGPLKEVITFTEPIIEPAIHPYLKFRDDPSKLFLENLTDFEFNASISPVAGGVVRFSNGDPSAVIPNLYQVKKTGTPVIANPFAVASCDPIPATSVNLISSVSVDMSKSDFKLYLIQYSVSPLIERKMTSKLPFHRYDMRVVQDQNLIAGGKTLQFETKNIGSVPYHMLLYGVYNNALNNNFECDRRVGIKGVEIGLGTQQALFSKRFDRNQLIDMTHANGLPYNFRKKKMAKVMPEFRDLFLEPYGGFVNITNGTNNIGVMVNNINADETSPYEAPIYRDVQIAGDFVLLNFTNDICSMSHSLAPGTMCNLPLNISVDVETEIPGPITLYCFLIHKYELTLDRLNNTSSIKQELFTATQVLDAVNSANGNRVHVTDDLLIGGNLFSFVKNNFVRWLPKVRNLIDTASKMKDHYDEAKKVYNEHGRPLMNQVKDTARQSGFQTMGNMADRLDRLGFGAQ